MDYIPVLLDSIETSVSMGIFPSKLESCNAHLYKSKLVKFPIKLCKTNLENFNPDRLKKSATLAYPLTDRPRGAADISSVKFYQRQLRSGSKIQPIWIVKKRNKHILLDGAHRIVASYAASKKYVYAYVISV